MIEVPRKSRPNRRRELIAFSAGVVVASVLGARNLDKTVKGLEIVNAGLYTVAEDGTQFLNVMFKNGSYKNFLWETYPVTK